MENSRQNITSIIRNSNVRGSNITTINCCAKKNQFSSGIIAMKKDNSCNGLSKAEYKKAAEDFEKIPVTNSANDNNIIDNLVDEDYSDWVGCDLEDAPDFDEYLDISRQDIYDDLNNYIVGQDDVLKSLSLLARKQLIRADSRNDLIQKENYMLIGPTGSGKSGVIKALDKVIPLPVISIDSSKITPSGYKGLNISECLIESLRPFNDNEYLSYSIIVFDEFDKLITKARSHDQSYGMMCQAELLKVIEGTFVRGGKNNSDYINTRDMSFIFAGAFEDCFKQKNIVIGSENKQTRNNITDEDSVRQLLIEFGAMSEIIGRIGNISFLKQLEPKDYADICYKAKGSIIDSYKQLCKSQNGKLVVHKDALLACAEAAVKKGLGVRGMELIINHALSDQMCDLFDGKRKAVHLTTRSLRPKQINVNYLSN